MNTSARFILTVITCGFMGICLPAALAAPPRTPTAVSTPSHSSAAPKTCTTVTSKGKVSSKDGALEGTLVRENCRNGCITGTLTIGGFQCKTLELPWNDNKPNKSCIPVDEEYVCKRVISPRFGETFEITDVDGRTYVLFHAGNTEKNTSGCVLLGLEIDEQNHIKGGTSRPAVEKFMKALRGYNEFKLTITDKTGTCPSSS